MRTERTRFGAWLAGLPFLVRCLVLSLVMLSGAGVVVAIRVASGPVSPDLAGLVPAVLLVVAVAVIGAWRTGRRKS
jgi:hypothetical protein